MVGVWAGLSKILRCRKKKKDSDTHTLELLSIGQMDHFIQTKRSFDTEICKICTKLLQFCQNA